MSKSQDKSKRGLIALAAIGLFSMSTIPAATAAAKCTSIQAKCAIEAGGECNPETGRWQYGFWKGKRAGGNSQNFLHCLDRELAKRKK